MVERMVVSGVRLPRRSRAARHGQAQLGPAGTGRACSGAARLGTTGTGRARLGSAGCGKEGGWSSARFDSAPPAAQGLSWARHVLAGPGVDRFGTAWKGEARTSHKDVRGMAGQGSARRGKFGLCAARFGSAVLGKARGRGDGRRSGSTPGHRTHGLGAAGTGMDRHGAAWNGWARHGKDRFGPAGQGKEPQKGAHYDHTIHTVT